MGERARVEQHRLLRKLRWKNKKLMWVTAKIAAEKQHERRKRSAENLREKRLTKKLDHETKEWGLVHAKLVRVEADLKRHKGADLVKERARLALLKRKLVLDEGLEKHRSRQLTETIKRNQRILMRTRIKVAKLHSRSKHIKVKLFKILVKLKALRQREKRERRKAHRREIHLTRILRQEKVRFKRLLAKKRTAWTVVRNLHRRLRAVDARLAHKNEKIKIVQLHYQ